MGTPLSVTECHLNRPQLRVFRILTPDKVVRILDHSDPLARNAKGRIVDVLDHVYEIRLNSGKYVFAAFANVELLDVD